MRLLFLGLACVAAALDFQWTFEGENYWATEVTRFSTCRDKDHLAQHIGPDGLGYFGVGEVEWPQFSASINSSDLSLGAYIVTKLGGQVVVAKAYQVKPDPAIAFMSGAVPDGDDTFSAFHGGDGIPVPPSVGEGPLAGLRFAVKDIFHVEGLKTSGGSRAYYSAYGPQNYTTQTVMKSLESGAQLVGKTKTIAFALGTPRNGWEVDYQDPWNLRGDGYQTTGGSSSGSSAAIIAYDWLDFTIGSDTGGSVRFPARFGGFYGYKPTWGVFNITGILVAIAEQDTPGFMARSPEIFGRVYNAWAKGTELEKIPGAFPTKLQYWSDETPLTQVDAQAMVSDFFTKVESTLGFTSFSTNVTAEWAESGHAEPVSTYLYTTYQDQNSAETWDQIGEPLYRAFAAQNDGAFPPADPVVNLTWADGVNATTRARFDEAVGRRLEYADFFNTHVLPPSDETCTESIVAHTLHTAPSTVKYDQTPFRLVAGFYNGLQASFAGTPEIVVPIGQVQYYSPFTRKMEWQAVTVAFQVAKGCDGVLFALVEKLAAAGLITEVMSGKTAYPV